MSRKNVFIIIGVVLVGAAVVGANFYFKKDKGLTVTTEVVKTRDLEAIVAASGKIQPKRLVQISADTPGPRREPRGQRGRSDQEGPVPAADRPEVAAHARRQQHGVTRRGAGLLARRRRRSSRSGSRSKRRGSSWSRRARRSRDSRICGGSS